MPKLSHYLAFFVSAEIFAFNGSLRVLFNVPRDRSFEVPLFMKKQGKFSVTYRKITSFICDLEERISILFIQWPLSLFDYFFLTSTVNS